MPAASHDSCRHELDEDEPNQVHVYNSPGGKFLFPAPAIAEVSKTNHISGIRNVACASVATMSAVPPPSPLAQVSCGSSHTVMRAVFGAVFGCGSNDREQLWQPAEYSLAAAAIGPPPNPGFYKTATPTALW